VCDPAERPRVSALLARLRCDHAGADDTDPHSTIEPPPTVAEVSAAIGGADRVFVAAPAAAGSGGYGLTWSWVEDDGTQVQLLDVWAVPGADRHRVEAELFDQLEAAVRARVPTAPQVVLGANCRSTETARLELLLMRGFTPVFDMVEMQAPSITRPTPALPGGLTLRSATGADVAAIADLTSRVWAGRAFFTMPSVDDVRSWLLRADPELYLLAVDDSTAVVGLASATLRPQCAEIDDVQVDPGWQRRGVASALLVELRTRLARRTSLPVRLHTEGHDPAGALSLYEHQGFSVVATHHRLRKPL
jgi:mycothiol synthase